jgi:hypothetical protein
LTRKKIQKAFEGEEGKKFPPRNPNPIRRETKVENA